MNVWEAMSDVDILVGAFENIVSGPEYSELRKGGAKRLNMQFFKDIHSAAEHDYIKGRKQDFVTGAHHKNIENYLKINKAA